MDLLVAQLLNGLVYGVLLFLMAAGLSLIFGLMNVVSLAHGSFFMLGAYLGLSIFRATGSFWLALVLAPIPVIVIGVAIERLFLRPLYRRGHMDQVLLTFGFTFVFLDLVQTVWGRSVQRLPVPEILQGTMHIGAGVFSAYRLFLIGFGFAIALLLWLFLERSRIGAMVRAGVDDAQMAAGLGGNIPALFSGMFGFGVALAALGGVAAGPILSLYPGMDAEILIPAFIVIVIGGLGSLRGAFVGSLLIGIADTFGKAYLPSLALFLIYLAMILVLLVRPQGLFGIKYSDVSDSVGRHHHGRADHEPDAHRRAGGAAWRCSPCRSRSRTIRETLVAEIFIFAIFAMSLDLLLGFTGLMSLGHAAFFGLGAYAVAVLGTMFGINAWIGVVRWHRAGRPRRRPDRLVLRADRRRDLPDADARVLAARLHGGVEMARRHRRLRRIGDRRRSRASSASISPTRSSCIYMALIFFVLVFAGLRRLINAPLGRVFVGIRENEQRMMAVGYPTKTYKLLSFTISAAIAGLCRRPLRHLQRLHLGGRALLDRIRRRPDHDHARRRRHLDRPGDRRRRVPADEERGELVQRALARHHRHHLYLLRHVLPGRHLGRDAGHPDEEGPAMTALRIDHLNRSFGSLVVTDDVSLDIAAGERHVIIGPNGAGKTSLVNQIGGQLAPSSGHILVDGQDITGRSPDRISRMGVARTFQRNNLFQNLSVIENLRLALEVRFGKPLDFFRPADRNQSLDGAGAGFDGAGASRHRRHAAGPQSFLRRAAPA